MKEGRVANNIERLRNERGYTQETVANVLKISRATYNNKESGKRDWTISEIEQLAMFFNVPVAEFFDEPRNNEKFLQMYFYTLDHFKEKGIPKTKLAKLLYLIDFSNFYEKLEPMSGVRYVRRDYGPVADIFFEMTDLLFDSGKISIEPVGDALMISSTSFDRRYDKLTDEDKTRIDNICELWHDKRTSEIVNFTHEQKPWLSCRDGEYIPYELIIQEDPDHVFTPAL